MICCASAHWTHMLKQLCQTPAEGLKDILHADYARLSALTLWV